MKNIQAFVPTGDLEFALDSKGKVFELVRTEHRIIRTASAAAVLDHQYVSADHCQEGSDKVIYRLRALTDDESALRVLLEPARRPPSIPWVQLDQETRQRMWRDNPERRERQQERLRERQRQRDRTESQGRFAGMVRRRFGLQID